MEEASGELAGLRLLAALPVALYDTAHCGGSPFARFFDELLIGLLSHPFGARGLAVWAGWRALNTGATVGVAVAAGVFSAFVTGKSAVFQSGREFRVQTREAIPVVLPTT